MFYKAYIQSLNGIPQDDWAFAAYQEFMNRGTKVIFFEDGEIDSVPVSKFNIVVGSFRNTIEYFKSLGIEIPKPLNIPECLLPYANRKIEIMDMKRFKEWMKPPVYIPIFIKPQNDVKAFMAGIIEDDAALKSFYSFNKIENVTDETMVFTSQVVDLASEYRGFVYDGKLRALHYYKGDYRYYPDLNVVEKAIEDYKDAPAGYSIDFGVIARPISKHYTEQETVLIECNDGWSLGSYGCDPYIYTTLLCKRWLELTNVKL